MINEESFTSGLELLQLHFNRELSEPVIKLWKLHLDNHLSTEEWQQAVAQSILNDKFFPTAGSLVETIKGTRELLAHTEWQNIIYVAAGRSAELYPLSDNAVACLKAIGNISAVALAENYRLNQLQSQFINLYVSGYFTNAAQLRALPPLDLNQKR